jgi:hypothetical protein
MGGNTQLVKKMKGKKISHRNRYECEKDLGIISGDLPPARSFLGKGEKKGCFLVDHGVNLSIMKTT